MSWLISTLIIGISAAFATTFDDNLYLTAFFGKVNRSFRPKHIVIAEFLGFTALVFASLPGFFGGLIIPTSWEQTCKRLTSRTQTWKRQISQMQTSRGLT